MPKKEPEKKEPDQKEPEKKEPPQDDTQKKIVQALKYLHDEMKAMKEDTEKRIKAFEGKATPDDKKKTSDKPDGMALERMDRAEFANHILGQIGVVFDEKLKAVQERIEVTEDDTRRSNAKTQIKEAMDKHDDFMEWKDHIAKVLEAHPELDIESAYTLARHRDPEKVQQIDKEIAEKKAAEDKKSKKETVFGGLFATSGGAERNEKMKPKDAAEAAWEEVGMSEHLAALEG